MVGVLMVCLGHKHNMNSITDFTDTEQKLTSTLLLKRYGKLLPIQLADCELQLSANSEELTSCPTQYWTERGAQFVVCKVGENRYRCQFFYSDAEHYGTGHDEYSSLEECVLTLLQVQADHEQQLSNISSGATASNLIEEYHGPLVI